MILFESRTAIIFVDLFQRNSDNEVPETGFYEILTQELAGGSTNHSFSVWLCNIFANKDYTESAAHS